jgi:hypothetical protein
MTLAGSSFLPQCYLPAKIRPRAINRSRPTARPSPPPALSFRSALCAIKFRTCSQTSCGLRRSENNSWISLRKKTEPLDLLDRFEIGDFPLLVKPIAAFRPAGRPRQQTRFFIEAYGIDTQTGFLCDVANLKRVINPSIQSGVDSRVKLFASARAAGRRSASELLPVTALSAFGVKRWILARVGKRRITSRLEMCRASA